MLGIDNIDEFYSAHFGAAILAFDIREVLDDTAEAAPEPPPTHAATAADPPAAPTGGL